MEAPNVSEWFDEGELELCPHCQDARLIPRSDGGARICLTCGPLLALEDCAGD